MKVIQRGSAVKHLLACLALAGSLSVWGDSTIEVRIYSGINYDTPPGYHNYTLTAIAYPNVTNVCMDATNCPVGETIACTNGNLLILGGAVTNDGTLCATNAGRIEVYGPVLNRGTVSAVDGIIRFHNVIVNEGTYVGTNIFSVTRVPQLYFQNDAGVVARWTLDRFGVFQYSQLLGNMHEWKLMAAADIDGDGIDDLIWQTPDHRVGIWLMDENFAKRDARFYWNTGSWEVRTCSSATPAWSAALFFQRPDGMAALWNLATDGGFRSAELLGNRNAWRLRAVAPRQQYAPPDLLWQRPDGGVVAWTCDTNNNNAILPQWLANAGDWVLHGSVDIDGDGTADLLWQTPDFRVGGWLMNSNGAPREAHFWWQTRGWHLRAAGSGNLVFPLNPATPPDTNDTINIANQWLATGGTLTLTGTGGSLQTNCIITAGTLSITQRWNSAGGGFTNPLERAITPPPNGAPGGVLGTVYSGQTTCNPGGAQALVLVGSVVQTGGIMTMGGSSGGLVVVSNSLTSGSGSLTQTGSGTLILTATNIYNGGTLTLNPGIPGVSNTVALGVGSGLTANLNGGTIHVGTNSFDLSTVLTGGNGVVTWLGSGARLYTNNVLLASVTLQLETNAVTGEITGTLNPATDAVALGAMTVSNLFTIGSSTFSVASPITFPGIIYTNGTLQLLGSAPTP